MTLSVSMVVTIRERLEPIINALIELGLIEMADTLTDVVDEVERRAEMTDTEILEAIIKHKMRVHPATGYNETGWTASIKGNVHLAWNRPTLRQAVEDVITQVKGGLR